MSFPFYDRVQSGQLISPGQLRHPLGADVHDLRPDDPGPVQHRRGGLRLHALDQRAPGLRGHGRRCRSSTWSGVRMRKSMFPVSWLIQSRLADVATIVDENVNGVRVVKSFAAEQQQLRTLAKAADTAPVGATSRTPTCGPGGRRRSRTSPRSDWPWCCCFGGYMVIHGHLGVGAILAFNFYLLMLQAPFMMLGHAHHDGPARRGVGRAHLRDPRRAARPSWTGPAPSTSSTARATSASTHVDFAYAAPTTPGARRLRPAPAPGRDGGPGRPDRGRASRRVARLLTRFYDVTGRAGGDRRPRRPRPHPGQPAGQRRRRARRAVPLLGVDPGQHRLRPARRRHRGRSRPPREAAGADEFIRELPEGYDTVVGERGYTLSGGQRQRIAIARTLLVNPPILVLDDATSAIDVQVEQQIHDALRVLMEGRTTLIIAHRLSTISLADRVVLLDDGHDRGRRHPRRAARDHAALRRGPGPGRPRAERGPRRRRRAPVPTPGPGAH